LDPIENMSHDHSRNLAEWALAAGRFFQSPQTKFIHLYYGESSDLRAQTIPIIENVLFVLALFRSRLVEQIQEGKGLLKQLLAFQQKQEEDLGNFPVYVHEYPICHDPALSIQLLAPFYWILKSFGHILGSDLKQQLEQTMCLALKYSIKAHQQKSFPYFLSVRLAAAQLTYGLLWDKEEWKQAGQAQMEQWASLQLEGWNTTKQLANILIGLQMVYPSLSNSPWRPLWKRMEETWHLQLACYMGPHVREWQEREEPQVNLYDLFGGFFSGQFSRRATLLSFHHLHGILIQPSADQFKLETEMFPIIVGSKQQAWQSVFHHDYGYTLLEKKGPFQPSIDKTETPFRFVWGDHHRLHSLVCQGGNIEKVKAWKEGDEIVILFDLREQRDDEVGGTPKSEIEFFVDIHPDIQFRVNGLDSNTFGLGESFQILFKDYFLTIIFELVQGEGDFFGHLMRGNRPSQVDLKGEKRFQAYDWTFFLRTIRRQNPCQIKATLSLKNQFA